MLDKIFVFGFNHQTISEEKRSGLAFSQQVMEGLYDMTDANQVGSLVVLQTCNRSEIYGTGDVTEVINTVSKLANLDKETLLQANVLTNEEAITYIFEVAAGLRSQVVGDMEILGQFKQACKIAKLKGRLDGSFEKCINIAIQAAKEVRTDTKIMKGTVSLSYAVVKLLKSNQDIWEGTKKTMVIGAGDFARKIVKEITESFPMVELIIANRSLANAQKITHDFGGEAITLTDIAKRTNECSIIISAIHNPGSEYIIEGRDVTQPIVCIDYSVPKVISPDVTFSDGCKLYGVDDAASIINKTIIKRNKEIPQANDIIQKHVRIILEWCEFYAKRESITIWKEIVQQSFMSCPVLKGIDSSQKEKLIKKGITDFSLYLRQNSSKDIDASQAVLEFQRTMISPKAEKRLKQSLGA